MSDSEMEILSALFYGDSVQSPLSSSTSTASSCFEPIKPAASYLDYNNVYGLAYEKMDQFSQGKHGLDEGLEENQWSEPYGGADFPPLWPENCLNGEDTAIPSYLLAASMRSPIPQVNYGQNAMLDGLVKQEPYSPSTGENEAKFQSRRTQPTRKTSNHPIFTSNRPLVERQKRHSDDDTGSISSVLSDATDDGSATSANSTTGGGLPALPRIQSVTFADPSKRHRRDVSMSAPAVAARELRQKKKVREEHLITECDTLKAEAEALDKSTAQSLVELKKLREDAQYLRSLVKSQASTVSLLEYLQKAPFFQEGSLQLDARTIVRQISGDSRVEERKSQGETGGVCLHINGAKVTLHLCSHCSSAD